MAQKKYASYASLQNLVGKIKELFATKTDLNTELAKKADSSHTHSIANVTNLQNTLDGKVPTSRTVNGKALSANITLSASDVGAATSSHSHDDRYYTESEVDTKLSGKANSSHTHTIANVTDLQAALNNKSNTDHSHTTHSQSSMSNTDLNTIKTAGWYFGYTGMTNAPVQTIAVMEVLVYSPDWIVQRFTVVNGAEYIRHWHSATTWSEWKTEIDSGNIGSQSVNYANSAGKATKDGSGNTITSTYETKTGVDNKISTHNTSTSAHNDIRDLITGLTNRLNALADSDDTTLDQLSEIVSYIKANKALIDSITTSKVNVSDIINNLTTNVTNKPLSAAQGVAIKALIDALQTELDSIPQSDWGQSDDTKLDYIKNRTHWSKTESSVVSEETVDTSDYTYTFTTPFVLNIGQTYIVVFDGVTYNCVAFRDNMNYNRATIGGSYGDFSTYPFSICVKSSGDTCIETEVLSTHTVKVTNVVETIQKLDVKYIPDTFAKTADIEVMVNDVKDTLSDRIDKKANTSDISSGFVANVVTTLSTSNWKGVAYGNGKYVAVGDKKFAYSTDGVSWSYGTLPFYANGIAYGNGMFCAYGYSSNAICYSTDGINWSTANTNYNSNYFSIYFLNDRFVISAGYAILYSTNCVNWSKYELGESCTLYGGAYGNGVYIMSGYGKTFTSTNGTTWTKSAALSTTENYGSIFFVDGKFIAIAHGTTSYGSSNKIAYSTNGTSWTYGTLPKSGKWVEAAYCNGAFMIAGYQSLAYSNDGVNWEVGSLPEGWSTIETMGSGNDFLLFEGSGDEVAIVRENPFDLVFKSDSTKTLIYDSGEITAKANSISNINISGYKKIMVAVACINDGGNISKSGSAIFKSSDGTTYQFPVWTNLFSTSADVKSSGIAQFEIMDGYLLCPFASRSIRTNNFFSDTDGGTADNMAMTGSGLLKCTKDIKTLTISSLDQDTSCSFGIGSRVMVWGCKA